MKTIFGQQLDDVHKILIVRLRSIGDMILIGPAVAALRKAYPGAEITVLSEPLCLPVVERNPLYDRVIIFNIQGLKQCPKKQVAAEYFKFSRFLHKKRFDLAVDFHGGPRAAGITLLCGSRHRLGYDLRGRRWAYTIRNEVPIGDPMYLTHLKLIRAIGVLDQVPVDDNLLFPLLSAERQWAEEYIREKVHGLKSELSMKIVVFHIGGRFDFKCWPRECFIELVKNSYGMKTLLYFWWAVRMTISNPARWPWRWGQVLTHWLGRFHLGERELFSKKRISWCATIPVPCISPKLSGLLSYVYLVPLIRESGRLSGSTIK